jgi:hypothetical protein
MIELKRFYDKDCTMGRLNINNLYIWTLELPWLDNEKNISCIPEGIYNYHFRVSPSNGDVLELENVKDRKYIQIHIANYTRDILGCVAVGDGIKYMDGDNIPDVTNSGKTFKKLLKEAGMFGKIKIYS